MLDTGVGITAMVLVCAAFLFLGITYAGRRRQSVEDYTVSRNHAPVNVGIATLVASMFGTWVLLSPGEAGANFGIISLVGYAVGMSGIAVLYMVVGPRLRQLMPNGHSVTEYVKHRFGTVPFVSISVVIIFIMGIFITAEMTAITTAVNILTGSPAWATAIAVGIVVVAYTAYGGLRASIYTDRIQFWVLMPALLLLVIVAAALVGDTGTWQAAREAGLLSVSSEGSYFFGIVLIIGIIASNAFHPGMWQRVYTVESQKSLNRSLWGAMALAIPITFLLGMAGIAAVGHGSVESFVYPDVSAALFALGTDLFPLWMHFLMLVCALMLAMSTLDTLMNGVASGLATDMASVGVSRGALMMRARAVTTVMAIPAIIVASQGYSVLYVFLVADLPGRGHRRAHADRPVLQTHARLGGAAGRRGRHHHRGPLLSQARPGVTDAAHLPLHREPDVLVICPGPDRLVSHHRRRGPDATLCSRRRRVRFHPVAIGCATD